MGRRLLWTFLLIVTVITTAAVVYVQSETFARIVRARLQGSVAQSLGVELNFDRLKIGVLPPSVSLVNVDLMIRDEKNKLGLSPDTIFRAGALGVSFRMIQAFSSGIEVNKVFLSDAELKLRIPKLKGKGGESEKLSSLVHRPIRIEFSNTFAAMIRQLELRNTKLDLTPRRRPTPPPVDQERELPGAHPIAGRHESRAQRRRRGCEGARSE